MELSALYERAQRFYTEDERRILQTYRVARPAAWELRSPALLVVDVVESFAGPDLPVAQAQQECVTACGQNAWRAVERIEPLLHAFRAADAPVAFSTITSLPPPPGAAPRRAPSTLRADTVVAPLTPVDGELLYAKTQPSAFHGSPLQTWLMSRRVDQVVIVGGSTSGCIRATALDAYSLGYEVLIPMDGVFDRVEASHITTLTDIDVKYGRVVDSADIVGRMVPAHA